MGASTFQMCIRDSAYTGTLLFVSHDRYFIRQVAESLLIFDEQSVFYYPFGYEHYLERKEKESGQDMSACIRAEEQALISGLQSVPLPERHQMCIRDSYLDSMVPAPPAVKAWLLLPWL